MASETATETDVPTETTVEPWQAGALGGILGAIAFGAMAAMMMPPMLEEMIPMMYGLEGELAGWAIHVFHGVVLGVVFALIVDAIDVDLSLPTGAASGVGYGIVVWAVLAVVVMPVWLGMTEMVPDVNLQSLGGHAVYGLILGVVYVALAE